MPYKLSIPGQVSEFQLKCIEQVATLVPAGGTVVEVGSLFGRSSYAWAKSVPQDARVVAIDPWTENKGVERMAAAHGVTYGIDAFRAFTSDCPNIVAHQGYSPKDFAKWEGRIHVYYEDAVHSNPVLRSNLDLWTERLIPEGIVCGDDYRPRFPDVVTEVNQLADRMRREVLVVDFFWCLLPEERELAGASRVRNALLSLAAEATRLEKQNPVAYTLELLDIPTQVKAGSTVVARMRLTNESKFEWHPWFTRHRIALKLASAGAELADPAFGGAVTLAPLLFPPDIGREFAMDVVVPAGVEPGDYTIDLAIEGPDGSPLKTGRIGKNIARLQVVR